MSSFRSARLLMLEGLIALLAVEAVSMAAADEPTVPVAVRLEGIAEKLRAAQEGYLESIKSGKPNAVLLRAAQKERLAELEKLAAELEAIESAEQGFAEHQTLASIYVQLNKWDRAIQHAQAAVALQADAPAAHRALVMAFSQQPDLDAAEAAFTAALAACQDKQELLKLHATLAVANRRGNRPLPAALHLAEVVPGLRTFASPSGKITYLRNVKDLATAFADGGEAAKGLAHLEAELAFWNRVKGEQTTDASEIVSELQAQKIRGLHVAGDRTHAEALLAAEKIAATAQLDAQPSNVQAVIRMAKLLEVQADIAPQENEAEREAWLKYLTEQFVKQPAAPELAAEMSKAYLAQMQVAVAHKQYETAENLLHVFQDAIASLPGAAVPSRNLTAAGSLMKSQLRRLQSQRLQQELVGQPMIPLDVAAWVNGSPQSAEDLRGKVVLLDFWAVWCSPCRATFPHLIEWHNKYAEKGFVIVGLSRYYQYGWNADAKQHEQVEDISAADEAAAAQQFAEHHGLKHRLAFMPDESALADAYGVSGIPHVVLIDRQGVIRMIRVGSGEANAHDLGMLIDQLVNESAVPSEGE